MIHKTWCAKRQRQFARIKESLLELGEAATLAGELAAAAVNKERLQHGVSVRASASSINDLSAARRAGLHSHQSPGARTLP